MKDEPYGLGRQTLPANIARPIAKVAKLYVSRSPSQYLHITPGDMASAIAQSVVLPALHIYIYFVLCSMPPSYMLLTSVTFINHTLRLCFGITDID